MAQEPAHLQACARQVARRRRKAPTFLDGPEVLAVSSAAVRAEFLKAYSADNADTKGKAYERALKRAVEDSLVCAREIGAEGFKIFV